MSSDECEAPDIRVRLRDVDKVYRIWARPQDRLKEMLWRGRRRYHREFEALHSIDLELRRGETVGIVGRNGAGKSTLLRIICGIVQATRGVVEIRGQVAPLLAIGAGFNVEFTGRENAILSATILGRPRDEIDLRLGEIEAFADIGDFVDQPVSTYSTGMFSRLAFAVAIHCSPDILVVDEVLAVGDEAFSRKCFARIQDLKASGATILLASHSARTILELCDRAVLIEAGRRLLTAAPDVVISRYQKLLYSSVEARLEVMREIEALDRSGADPGTSEATKQTIPGSSVEAFDEGDRERKLGYLDPALQPASTLEFPSQGARISNVHILDPAGRKVNVLRRGAHYRYCYDVDFLEDASQVRFGMMLKLTSGLDLAGQVSHPAGQGIANVARGRRVRVTFDLVPTLVPGTYFLNAGVLGNLGDEEGYLHRLLDIGIFRIDQEKGVLATGPVDLSGGRAPRFAIEDGSDEEVES